MGRGKHQNLAQTSQARWRKITWLSMQYTSVPPRQHIETVAPASIAFGWRRRRSSGAGQPRSCVHCSVADKWNCQFTQVWLFLLVWGSFSGSRDLPIFTQYPVLSCFRKVHVWTTRLPVALLVEKKKNHNVMISPVRRDVCLNFTWRQHQVIWDNCFFDFRVTLVEPCSCLPSEP